MNAPNFWFTSDTHWHHKNIIKYCNRPFSDIDEMDEALIKNWNSVVAPQDTVYHLGDVLFGGESQAGDLFRRLNGIIYFIEGNHDKTMSNFKKVMYRDIFQSFENKIHFLGNLKKIALFGQKIILCHYAMRVWDCCHHGSWNLYGHSHHTLPDDPNSLSLDVGVDCHNYFPISFEQIKKIMSKKNFEPIDHHGRQED
jgi:calcineurin-like phosphoesterase family protein